MVVLAAAAPRAMRNLRRFIGILPSIRFERTLGECLLFVE
jgi:hypothetical protein